MTDRLLTLEEACEAIQSEPKPSRRWLNEFLLRTKTDPQGRPLYRKVGRAKTVYIDRVLEALPSCRSKSSQTEKPKRQRQTTYTSGGRTSELQLKRAAELTNDPSLLPNYDGLSGRSNAASPRPGKPYLIKG